MKVYISDFLYRWNDFTTAWKILAIAGLPVVLPIALLLACIYLPLCAIVVAGDLIFGWND